MSEDCHIRMNLIADNQQMMLVAKISQASKRIHIPSDASRIVRIAEYKNLALLIANLLQVVKIHFIIAILTHSQRIEYHFTSITLWSQTKRMIHRGLDDNFLVFFRKDIDYQSYTFHNTWNKFNPFTFYIPLVVVMHPIYDTRQKVFRLHGITEKRMLQTSLQSIGNESWSFKIHISHPKRQQIISAPTRQQSPMLEVVTARTVDYFIKIIFHISLLTFSSYSSHLTQRLLDVIKQIIHVFQANAQAYCCVKHIH